MPKLIDRDLIFSIKDSTKIVIASSNMGKAVSCSELEVGEDGGVWLVSSGFRIGVMTTAEVCGGAISEGDVLFVRVEDLVEVQMVRVLVVQEVD